MKKVFHYFDASIKALLSILAIAMIVIGFLQVFFRFVVKSPLTWSEELIRYIFVWTTFLGVPVGVDRDGHASFDVLGKRVPQEYKSWYKIFLLLLAGIMFVVFIVLGIPFSMKNLAQLTPAMHIPYAYVIAAVPTGGAVGVIYVIHCIFKELKKKEGT